MSAQNRAVRRRDFIVSIGAAALLGRGRARAQEADRVYRLGFFIPARRDDPPVAAFFDELRTFGFVEGKNLTVLPGGFDIHQDQLHERATALVQAAPDAIISGADIHTRALQQVTRTVPLIAVTENMVAAGLVQSLAQPGGNTTGISLLSNELDAKRQEILIEAVPRARKMAAFGDAKIVSPGHLETLQDIARVRGVELSVFPVIAPEEIRPAVEHAKASGAEAINVLASPLFSVGRRAVIEHSAALRLPIMCQWPEMAEEGAFAAYGPRFTDIFRQRARIVVKVLRGAKPADLPVEQPTDFELVINARAARAMGHEIPAEFIVRADKVIE